MGLNTERPPDLLNIFRHRTRPLFAQVAQTADEETQTDDFPHETDSADTTIQMSCGLNAEESGLSVINRSQDTSVQLVESAKFTAATVVTTPSSTITTAAPSTAPAHVPASLPAVTNINRPQPLTPYSAPFPQPVQLQHSARALKDELQQGVEDVCQKLNSFFGKPQSLPGSNPGGSRQTPSSFTGKSSSDRSSSFSLFNNK